MRTSAGGSAWVLHWVPICARSNQCTCGFCISVESGLMLDPHYGQGRMPSCNFLQQPRTSAGQIMAQRSWRGWDTGHIWAYRTATQWIELRENLKETISVLFGDLSVQPPGKTWNSRGLSGYHPNQSKTVWTVRFWIVCSWHPKKLARKTEPSEPWGEVSGHQMGQRLLLLTQYSGCCSELRSNLDWKCGWLYTFWHPSNQRRSACHAYNVGEHRTQCGCMCFHKGSHINASCWQSTGIAPLHKQTHSRSWLVSLLGDSQPSRLQLFQGTCQTCHHPCRAFFKARGVEAFFSALGPRSPSGFFSHVFPQKLRQQFPIVELGLPRGSKANPLRGEPWEACSHQRKKSAVLSGLHPQWNAVLRSAAGVAGESMTAFQ